MGDLISRKALMEDMKNSITENSDTFDWINLINRQPTAYDVDKIVKQLESYPELEVTQYPLHGKYLKKDSVLRILKGGGVDE